MTQLSETKLLALSNKMASLSETMRLKVHGDTFMDRCSDERLVLLLDVLKDDLTAFLEEVNRERFLQSMVSTLTAQPFDTLTQDEKNLLLSAENELDKFSTQ